MRKRFLIGSSGESSLRFLHALQRISASSETVCVQQRGFSLLRIGNTEKRKMLADKRKMSARIAEFCALHKSRQSGEASYA